MRFGELIHLEAAKMAKFTPHFLAFDSIKEFVISVTKSGQKASKEDTTRFVGILKKEADRINSFATQTYNDLRNSFAHFLCELIVVKRTLKSTTPADAALATCQASVVSLGRTFNELSDNTICIDRFCRINTEGFRKIIKKFDKLSGRSTGEVLYAEYGVQPFSNLPLPNLLIPLSEGFLLLADCDALISAALAPRPDASTGGGGATELKQWVPPASFERNTTKYWVREDDLISICADIVRHLPVLVFGKQGRISDEVVTPDAIGMMKLRELLESAQAAAGITSIYLDEPTAGFSSYHARIRREEEARLFRVRWYGDKRSRVFFERKTHHEKWILETSVKERFDLPLERLDDFLSGKWRPTLGSFEGEKNAAQMLELATEVQGQLVGSAMCATSRTAYARTAFQAADSNDVRISLDTDLWLVDEVGTAPSLSKTVTRKLALESGGATKSAFRFPHAVLEVKLGAGEPAWITDLLSKWAGSIVPVHKFSKYLSSVALFHQPRVTVIPHWFKDDGTLNIDLTGAEKEHPVAEVKPAAVVLPRLPSVELLKEVESAPISRQPSEILLSTPRESPPRAAPAPAQPRPRPPSPDHDADAGEASNDADPFGWAAVLACLGCNKGRFSFGEDNSKRFVPTRVEPKSFFANERTFIQWMSVAVLISGIAMAFLQSGHHSGFIAGITLFPISLMLLIYAITVFHLRARAMTAKRAQSYDDRRGPTLLVAALLVALVVNLVLNLPATSTAPGMQVKVSVLGFTVKPESSPPDCVQLLPDAAFPPFITPSSVYPLDGTLYIASESTVHMFTQSTGSMAPGLVLPSTDIECVTSRAGFLFVCSESPVNEIYMVARGSQQALRRWSLPTAVFGPKGFLEGLAYDSRRDVFWATVHNQIVALNLTDCGAADCVATSVNIIRNVVYTPPAAQVLASENPTNADTILKVGDLFYHALTDSLFVAMDNLNLVTVLDMATGAVVATFPLPGLTTGWEGFALDASGTRAYMAHQLSSALWEFSFSRDTGFPACARATSNLVG